MAQQEITSTVLFTLPQLTAGQESAVPNHVMARHVGMLWYMACFVHGQTREQLRPIFAKVIF